MATPSFVNPLNLFHFATPPQVPEPIDDHQPTPEETVDVIDDGEGPNDNRRALPPPVEDSDPGPSDWMSKFGPVCDGDYITLRNKAWGGITAEHSWDASPTTPVPGGVLVFGMKWKDGKNNTGPQPLQLRRTRMDNEFSFCIRRVEFNFEKKCWVLPSWKAWKDRKPLSTADNVVLLCPNSPDLALGTRNPPNSMGNNGDYKVELVHFPLITTSDVINASASGMFARILTGGFWKSKNVDFVNQSRCVWGFHSIGPTAPDRGLVYGGSPINIRNMWTEIRAQETKIYEFIGGSVVPVIINKNWHGGRNLTQAAGSNGKVIKLALHNKDTDDKAGWIIDAWHGNRYPVQRAMIPRTPPPASTDDDEQEGVQGDDDEGDTKVVEVPDLTDQIRHPPEVEGMEVDERTGAAVHKELEKNTQKQNPQSSRWFLDWAAILLFGKRWKECDYLEQITIAALLALGGFLLLETVAQSLVNKVL